MKRHAAFDSAFEDVLSLWRQLSTGRRIGKLMDLTNVAKRLTDRAESDLGTFANTKVDLYATSDGLGSAGVFEAGYRFAVARRSAVPVYWFMARGSKTMFLFHTRASHAALSRHVKRVRREYAAILKEISSVEDDPPA